MKNKIRIEIELLNPLMLVTDDDFIDIVYNNFITMQNDILTSNIKIKLDNKMFKINMSFEERVSLSLRYAITLIMNFEINIEDLFFHERYNTDKFSKEKIYNFQKSDVQEEIKKYIYDFTFAMNLAYPGLFEFSYADIFIDNEKYLDYNNKNSISTTLVQWCDLYVQCLKDKWPVIHILDFKKVWNWLNNKTNYFDIISKTPIDRALNALTYTMGDVSYEEIFYILIGIEALYNDNESNGIVEQIRAKTEVLLKRPKEYKKTISNLYKNRSEFLHGRLNFPNKYCDYTFNKEFENFFFEKYIKTADMYKAILISTIQEYILHNANQMYTKLKINLK